MTGPQLLSSSLNFELRLGREAREAENAALPPVVPALDPEMSKSEPTLEDQWFLPTKGAAAGLLELAQRLTK